MRALIMAGGVGSRLNMGEKPLVTICEKPMITYVIEAFAGAGMEVIVVASPKTPMTKNWCRAHGIPCFGASGGGYIADVIEAAVELEEDHPFYTCVADLPCLDPDLIADIHAAYGASGLPALSTWVPRSLCMQYDCRTRYIERDGKTDICPAGVNILHGGHITEEQAEHRLVIADRRLVFNINTRGELAMARKHLCPENASGRA
ncbi:MAG: 5-deoxyadenosylcobinamide phosphate nucleotidyltransferase [Methanoculleus sp. SDB]|nr:MAG: 5-deoxyadenosylcobinamide phosphate nucleotidyltransferase [Methanoculleus sp. SDB]